MNSVPSLKWGHLFAASTKDGIMSLNGQASEDLKTGHSLVEASLEFLLWRLV